MSAISTPAGTICLRVDYRTSMTIAPIAGGSCSSGTAPYFISATGSSGNDTASNTSNSASGTATGSQPIMMKSDHFHFAQVTDAMPVNVDLNLTSSATFHTNAPKSISFKLSKAT